MTDVGVGETDQTGFVAEVKVAGPEVGVGGTDQISIATVVGVVILSYRASY